MRFLSRLLFGFVAGFIAILAFHQGMQTILHHWGFTPRAPFPLHPTQPFGVPQIWSIAFWGGVWGIVFGAFDRIFPRGIGYWVTALLFGAFLLTLAAIFLLPLVRGQSIPAIRPSILATGLMVNGAWGIGTGLFLRGFAGK